MESLNRSFTAQLDSLQNDVNSKNELIDELNNKLLISMEAFDELKHSLEMERNQTKELGDALGDVEAEKVKVKEEMMLLLDQSTDHHPVDSENITLQQQVNMLIKEKYDLKALVTEKDVQLGDLEDKMQHEMKHLQDDVYHKKSQINELVLLLEGVSTNSDQLPTGQVDATAAAPMDLQYLLKKSGSNEGDNLDSFGSIEDLNSQSELEFSDGAASLKQQMNHTIAKYEKQISELQLLYDQDISVLEKEKETLQHHVDELTNKYANVNNSNTMSVLYAEDLKLSYEDKIAELKTQYDEQLQQANANTNVINETLKVENDKLQRSLLEVEVNHQQELSSIEEEYERRSQLQVEVETQDILG